MLKILKCFLQDTLLPARYTENLYQNLDYDIFLIQEWKSDLPGRGNSGDQDS